MIIIAIVPSNVAAESHRDREEQVDVDINDTMETVKVKITLIYTELDPDKIRLECGGIRCREGETVLDVKKRVPADPLRFMIR